MNTAAFPLIATLIVMAHGIDVFAAEPNESSLNLDDPLVKLSANIRAVDYELVSQSRKELERLARSPDEQTSRNANAIISGFELDANAWLWSVGNGPNVSVHSGQVVVEACFAVPVEHFYYLLFNRRNHLAIFLHGPFIDDEHIQALSTMKNLIHLDVSHAEVSGKALRNCIFPSLKILWFDSCPIETLEITDLSPVKRAMVCERIRPGRSPERIVSDASETL